MIRRVRMQHTRTNAEIEVPERAVDNYRRSGWVPADEAPDEKPDEGPTAEPSAGSPSDDPVEDPPAGGQPAAAADNAPPHDQGGALQPGVTEDQAAKAARPRRGRKTEPPKED